MASNRHGLQLAQTAFPDYFSEPSSTIDTDSIRVKDFVCLASCAKKTEKQNKPTFQEIFAWFQREYGLPQVKAIGENETNGNRMGSEKTKRKKMESKIVEPNGRKDGKTEKDSNGKKTEKIKVEVNMKKDEKHSKETKTERIQAELNTNKDSEKDLNRKRPTEKSKVEISGKNKGKIGIDSNG